MSLKVAIYGKTFSLESRPFIETLYQELKMHGIEIYLYKLLFDFVTKNCTEHYEVDYFINHEDFKQHNFDFVITLGGDGTILDAVTVIRNSNVPVLGINLGRLGFLANVAKHQLKQAIQNLLEGKYTFSSRALLNYTINAPLQPDLNFALNEISVSRKDTTTMVNIHAWINNEYLTSYWADGLIVATPTGSTGYSLSCGGPIVAPDSENFVITPIAPHNLNIRPIVIPNSSKIRLKVESREKQFLLSADSRIYVLDESTEIYLCKETFPIKFVQTELQTFTKTLREKLYWGADIRN
jgi:NAD+ kinase